VFFHNQKGSEHRKQLPLALGFSLTPQESPISKTWAEQATDEKGGYL
jgi:hypothetical protein